MKHLQFWILLVGSLFVCALYVEQIYLSRAISQQQQILYSSQQAASLGVTYNSSWKQLATRVYEMSRQDPALADVLKRNQIGIQDPATSTAPASTKAAVGP